MVVMLVEDGVTSKVGVSLVTVTFAEVPVALLYICELEASAAKLAVKLAEPSAREPAGILIVTVPTLIATAAEEYPLPVTVTVPVGVGVPLTATVTVSAWALVMLNADGVTTTVGAALFTVMLGEAPLAAM
jgi:hypothetical protein